jgi:spore germination protein YaaH
MGKHIRVVRSAERAAAMAVVTAALVCSFSGPSRVRAQPTVDARPLPSSTSFESIWYTPGSGARRLRDAREHIESISVIAPQAFHATAEGRVYGSVSDSLLVLARQFDTRVMPLIMNRGFNQDSIHVLLHDPESRARVVRQMVAIGTRYGFWGWQFDFENVLISDRDSLTAFFVETAEALHDAGMTLSIAVVPTDGTPGETAFSKFMRENWRGSFDVQRLAEAGDFISLMTYSQHGVSATPGPVGGLPWMRLMVEYALSEGVPPEKISLGIPTYSGYWYSHFDEVRGPRVAGQEITFDRVQELMKGSVATTAWMEDQGVEYAAIENSGLFEWIFVEDRRSFEAKMKLFSSFQGLRGISVWVLGAEDPLVWTLLDETRSREKSR